LGNVPSDIAPILGPGEQVELFIQQKIYHPKINIDSVVLTSQRIILRHPHELGLKKDFTDFNYTDVANAILDKGILRSTVKITLRFGGDPLNLADLPNGDAEKAYGDYTIEYFAVPDAVLYRLCGNGAGYAGGSYGSAAASSDTGNCLR